jgi:hypothetical protein
MKPRRIFVTIASAILVVTVSGPVVAQIGYSENTIEASVAESSLIVRATVADLKFESVDDRPTKGWKRTIVTLKVKETLKGRPVETVTFGEGNYEPDRRYEAWKKAGTELLWFFGPNPMYGKSPTWVEDEISVRFPLQKQLWVRLGPGISIEKRYDQVLKPMFRMDLNVVEGPVAILEAVRASILYPTDRERAGVLPVPDGFSADHYSISVPHAIMARSGRVGDANSIGVPIDRRLETLARRLIESPSDFLPKETDAEHARNPKGRNSEKDLLRAEGTKALRYFKSESNVRLLKSLLADSATYQVMPPEPDVPYIEYFVRKAAYETLTAWKVAVQPPVLREALKTKPKPCS